MAMGATKSHADIGCLATGFRQNAPLWSGRDGLWSSASRVEFLHRMDFAVLRYAVGGLTDGDWPERCTRLLHLHWVNAKQAADVAVRCDLFSAI